MKRVALLYDVYFGTKLVIQLERWINLPKDIKLLNEPYKCEGEMLQKFNEQFPYYGLLKPAVQIYFVGTLHPNEIID